MDSASVRFEDRSEPFRKLLMSCTVSNSLDADRAVLQSAKLFQNESWETRLHVRGRVVTMNHRPLLDRLPSSGTLVDVGCGHGLFAFAAHVLHPSLRIVGTDPNAAKIEIATRVNPNAGSIQFACRAGLPPAGEFWDAITMIDMLQYIPRADYDAVLSYAYTLLQPGGVLMIKSHDPNRRWKYAWTWLHEAFGHSWNSVSSWRKIAFHPAEVVAGHLAGAGFAVEVVPMDRGACYAHVLYVARKPAADMPTERTITTT